MGSWVGKYKYYIERWNGKFRVGKYKYYIERWDGEFR